MAGQVAKCATRKNAGVWGLFGPRLRPLSLFWRCSVVFLSLAAPRRASWATDIFEALDKIEVNVVLDVVVLGGDAGFLGVLEMYIHTADGEVGGSLVRTSRERGDNRNEGFQEGFGAGGQHGADLQLRRQLHVDVSAAKVQLRMEVVTAIVANQKNATQEPDDLWRALDRVFDRHYGKGTLPTLYLIHPSLHPGVDEFGLSKVRRWGAIGQKRYLWADLKSGLEKRGHQYLPEGDSATLRLRTLETAMVAIHSAVRVLIPHDLNRSEDVAPVTLRGIISRENYSPPRKEVQVFVFYVHKDERGRKRGVNIMHEIQNRLQLLSRSGQEAALSLETLRLWPESHVETEFLQNLESSNARNLLLFRMHLLDLLPRLWATHSVERALFVADERMLLRLNAAVAEFIRSIEGGDKRRILLLVDQEVIEDVTENIESPSSLDASARTVQVEDVLLGFCHDELHVTEQLVRRVFALTAVDAWGTQDITPTLPSLPSRLVRNQNDAFQLLCAQVPWCGDAVCTDRHCCFDGLSLNRLPFYLLDGLMLGDILFRFNSLLELAGNQLLAEHLDLADPDEEHVMQFAQDAFMDVQDGPGWALFVQALDRASVAFGAHQFLETHRHITLAEEWMYEKRKDYNGEQNHLSLWEYRTCRPQAEGEEIHQPTRIHDVRELIIGAESEAREPVAKYSYGLTWYLLCTVAIVMGAGFTVGLHVGLQQQSQW